VVIKHAGALQPSATFPLGDDVHQSKPRTHFLLPTTFFSFAILNQCDEFQRLRQHRQIPDLCRSSLPEAARSPARPLLKALLPNPQCLQQKGKRSTETTKFSETPGPEPQTLNHLRPQPKGKRSTETTEFLSPQAMQILAKSRGMSLAGESANQTNMSNFSNLSETQDFLSPEGRRALKSSNGRGVAISHNMALFNSYSHTPTKSPPILPEWPSDVGGKYASSPVR
jgi:hypothetical protein